MIQIRRQGGGVLYTTDDVADIRTALQHAVRSRSDLRGADLSGADLRGADLSGAQLRVDFSGADLRGADLSDTDLTAAVFRGAHLGSANMRGADLRAADLRGADLGSADLTGARLSGADLRAANLRHAEGLAPERVNELVLLLDQPGKIRAYKIVNADGESIYARLNGQRPIRYLIGETYEVANANGDTIEHCGAGINVATLPWCLKEWRPGYRVFVVEFTKEDIAAIPSADGKFRLHRCKVVAEKEIDPVALGLMESVDKAQPA